MDPAHNLPPVLADRLGPLLGRAHDAHRAATSRALAPVGLSPKGFGAMAIHATEGPLSQRRLGERQGVDRTTMVAVLDELERCGAVERRRDSADRRAFALHLTPEGHDLLARSRALVVESERQFLAPLAPAEQEQLMRALRALLG